MLLRSPVQTLLVDCVSPLAGANFYALCAELNTWPQFCALADRHGVLLLAADRFDRLSPDVFAGQARRIVAREARAPLSRALELSTVLCSVVTALRRSGVRSLALKGPAMSALLYGSPLRRQSADLDVLISPDDAAVAVTALARLGYCMAGDSGALQQGLDLGHLVLMPPSAGPTLELQWDLGRRWQLRDTAPLDFETAWRGRAELAIDGCEVSTLGLRELALALPVHGARHTWSRLLWVCDIAALLESGPSIDWPQVLRVAGRAGCRRRVLLALLLAGRVFRFDLSPVLAGSAECDPPLQRLVAEHLRRLLPASEPALSSELAGRPDYEEEFAALRLFAMCRDGRRERLSTMLGLVAGKLRAAEAAPPRIRSRLVWHVRRAARLASLCLHHLLRRLTRRQAHSPAHIVLG